MNATKWNKEANEKEVSPTAIHEKEKKWVLSNLSFSNFNFIPQIQERMKNWEHGSNPSGTTLLEINNVEKLKWKSWVKQGIPKRIISFISVQKVLFCLTYFPGPAKLENHFLVLLVSLITVISSSLYLTYIS